MQPLIKHEFLLMPTVPLLFPVINCIYQPLIILIYGQNGFLHLIFHVWADVKIFRDFLQTQSFLIIFRLELAKVRLRLLTHTRIITFCHLWPIDLIEVGLAIFYEFQLWFVEDWSSLSLLFGWKAAFWCAPVVPILQPTFINLLTFPDKFEIIIYEFIKFVIDWIQIIRWWNARARLVATFVRVLIWR